MVCKPSVGVNLQEPKDDEFALGRVADLRSWNRRWGRHKSPPNILSYLAELRDPYPPEQLTLSF